MYLNVPTFTRVGVFAVDYYFVSNTSLCIIYFSDEFINISFDFNFKFIHILYIYNKYYIYIIIYIHSYLLVVVKGLNSAELQS